MRTTDPDPKPFGPLGERVQRPAPAAPAQKPQGPAGILTDSDGRMRTTTHKPR
jgi:hypothetical protein